MSGKVLVLGATGNVGTQLVAALLAKGEKVKAATRHATPVAGAEAVAFYLEKPSNLPDVLEGVDRIYLMVPGGHLNTKELTLPIIAAAAERNIKVVMQSVFGVDADDNIPYRQVELALIKSGAKHVILRPNWFSDNFHTYWIHGVKQGVIAVPAAEGKSSFIDVRDIAASAAAALTTSKHDGKAFNITGPEALGYADAAALISKATGRKVAYQPIDDASFIANLVGAGVPADYAAFLAMIFAPVREGWTAAVTPDVETLTGKAPRSVSTYVKDHAALFA
jgi:uncharacterized protein YbjT (DUF2867 family)